mgnify:CR=1 FL=1
MMRRSFTQRREKLSATDHPPQLFTYCKIIIETKLFKLEQLELANIDDKIGYQTMTDFDRVYSNGYGAQVQILKKAGNHLKQTTHTIHQKICLTGGEKSVIVNSAGVRLMTPLFPSPKAH